MEAEALLDALVYTLGEIKADIFFARLWPVCRPKNTVHYSLPEVKAQTPPKNLRGMETKASANTLAEIAAEVEAETMYKTLHDMRAETLVGVLYDTQGKKIELVKQLVTQRVKCKQCRCLTRWPTCELRLRLRH